MKPVLIIDPGHGGRDPGGGSCTYFAEKDMVLAISLYQADRFRSLGVPVMLTRSEDVTLESGPRTKLVRESGAKYCISNHINAADNASARGVETIHSIFNDGKLATEIQRAVVEEGMPGRRVFCREGTKLVKQDGKEVQVPNGKDYYFMHRDTGSVTTVIIEYGFATNEVDAQLLVAYWRDYAEAVVRAFCLHIGHSYSLPDSVITKPIEKKNDDVSEWARGARDWAVAAGITDGTRPRDPVTREEVWTMLHRALKS